MKWAAGDIVPSLTRLKKHGSQLNFFVSIFGKLRQINNTKSRKVATFKNCEIFSNYYFSYVPDYKATLSGGNKIRTQRLYSLRSIVNFLVVTSYMEKFKSFKKGCKIILKLFKIAHFHLLFWIMRQKTVRKFELRFSGVYRALKSNKLNQTKLNYINCPNMLK